MSNPDGKAAFQDEIYKKIDLKTAKAFIVVTHFPKRVMQKISTLVNWLPINFQRRNDIDKDIMKFEDTCGIFKCIFSSQVPELYTCNTSHLLAV